MNFSPNNVQLPNNQQFGQSFDVKNIFRPYPLITDRNLHPLTECVNHLVQEEVLKQKETPPLEKWDSPSSNLSLPPLPSVIGENG